MSHPRRGGGPARRLAILGNVSVGKTSIFDKLCQRGERSVNIPGSTLVATRGVVTVGPAAASRAFARHCASCSPHGLRFGRGDASPCIEPDGSADDCPALSRGSKPSLGSLLLSLGRGKKARPDPAADDGAETPGEVVPKVMHVFDTPGSSTLAAGSEDEMVARDLLLSGEMHGVLFVADAKNIRRSMALALQIAEFGLPMVLDLNMVDEAETMGVEVDAGELARSLEIPVGRTIAVENYRVRELGELLLDARVPKRLTQFPAAVERGLERLEEMLDNPSVAARGVGLLLLSKDDGAAKWIARQLGKEKLKLAQEVVEEVQAAFTTPLSVLISDTFHSEAERISDRAVTPSRRSPDLLVRFGQLAQLPLSGALIAFGVLLLAYYWVGAFGATYVVDNLSARLFGELLIPACDRLVATIPSAFVRAAFMDPDFGLLPTGLFLAVGIVLPILFCFYMLQAVLEDSGYLPRLAVLLDRLFRRIGLNGQGVIPLVLGFSCIAMAVITTRMLPTIKERIILTLLVVGVPCAPLLSVMFILLAKMPWSASALVFGLIGLRILVAGYLMSKFLGGERPDLILEIPRMRIPRPRLVLAKTWRRTWHFMREAVPIFLAASFVVFLFDRAGGLAVMERLSRPFVNGLLGLPDQAVQVFIKTAIRRENGATELNLLREAFSNVQMVVTLVVMTFLMPCINTGIVLIKERGIKVGAAILGTVMVSAIAIGAAVNLVCRVAGITLT